MVSNQNLVSRLAPRPTQGLKYSRIVTNSKGQEIALGDPLSSRAMVALMNAQAIFGGAAAHWGGPSALAEIMSAVHGVVFAPGSREWHEEFHFVNDAGHCENGVYALRANYGFDQLDLNALKGFRSFDSKLTGHGESHLNPEGVLLSNGPLASAVPQAQGLAMGDSLAGNDRTTFLIVSDGAAMEGEAKEAFAAIPGFAQKGKLNPFVMILSDNKTKLGGRIAEDSFSMQPTFASLSTMGWNVIEVADGHDLQAVFSAVESGLAAARANPLAPVCLWVHTIKGYGLAKTVASASGGHGFPGDMAENVSAVLAELYGQSPIPAEFSAWAADIEAAFAAKKAKASSASPSTVKKEKVQVGIAKAAERLAKENLPVISVASDLQGSTGMGAFHKAHPERCLDVGIAEANMISVAAGMSKIGYLPIVDTFAQFGVTKGLLPFTMASISQTPIIGVFSHVGYQDAADGASHQATTYVSALASVPYIQTIVLSCSSEADALMEQALRYQYSEKAAGRTPDSIVFFLGREDFPQSFVPEAQYTWGQPQILRQGKDALIVANGHMVVQALEAAELLSAQGVEVTVMQNAYANRPNIDAIGAALEANQGKLITIEDHQVVAGAGAILVHGLAQAGVQFKSRSLGMKGHFGHSAYKASELYNAHGLGAADLLAAYQALS